MRNSKDVRNMISAMLMIMLNILIYGICYGQTDTLWLQQINVINTPEYGITYVRDLNGDEHKEIIFSGLHHVMVYNGITGDTIWSSPYLTYNYLNEQVQFCDLNNDGNIEIAFVDSSNLQIFSPTQNQIIWTSSDFPQWRRLNFGFGDVNADGYTDIIITNPEAYNSDLAPDTVWVEYYLGPGFNFGGRHYLLLTAQGYPGLWDCTRESVIRILTGNIPNMPGPINKLIILTKMQYEVHWQYGGPEYYYHYDEYKGTGNIRFLNFDNFGDAVEIDSIGSLLPDSPIDTSNGLTYMLSEKYDRGSYEYPPENWDFTSYYRYSFSGASLQDSLLIAYNSNGWKGCLIGDLNANNFGNEIFLFYNYRVFLETYPALQPIWDNPAHSRNADRLLGPYHTPLLDNPQIMAASSAGDTTVLYDCLSGLQSAAILPLMSFAQLFIGDLNSDGEDEIIRTYWYNQIFIYHLSSSPVDINGNSEGPVSSFYMRTNYPNPFNTQTSISYALSKSGPVNLAIYNLLGQKVATLSEGVQQAGEHSIIWNAKDFSSGVYFAKLESGEETKNIKMVLLK